MTNGRKGQFGVMTFLMTAPIPTWMRDSPFFTEQRSFILYVCQGWKGANAKEVYPRQRGLASIATAGLTLLNI